MARGLSLLTQTTPTNIQPANVHIGHVQLRDLVICPHERGVLNYVQSRSIVEHDINTPNVRPRTLAELNFSPNTLASLKIPDTNNVLLAAGGQEAEIHLSLHSGDKKHLWHYEERLKASINNSVLLTSLSLNRSAESSTEPRMAVSNNDQTVKFFDIPVRTKRPSKRLDEIGTIRFNVPVNHSSISPDGRTLLSVGDCSKIFLHRMTGGARITFSPIATLSIPPPAYQPMSYNSYGLAASFSTAFSSDGTKYAVASQEGVLAIWDVRSSKPFKVFQTDSTRMPSGNGGWLSDDPWDWTRGEAQAPGWSVRNVKFGAGGRNGSGREIMTFTEHTEFLHVVDARTFETEEVIRLPPPPRPPRELPSVRHTTSPRSPNLDSSNHVSATSPVSRNSPPSYIILALEDTFRIPTTSTARTALDLFNRSTEPREPEDDDLVVIPPLGDSQVDDDVQTFLGRHSVSRRSYFREPDSAHVLSATGTGGRDDEMDVDESDCVSSHPPSRSSSPSPSVHVGVGTRTTDSVRLNRRHWRPWAENVTAEEGDDKMDVEEDTQTARRDLDIAGTCFDPSGARIYVATSNYVAEWRVNGAEKRWWLDDRWLV